MFKRENLSFITKKLSLSEFHSCKMKIEDLGDILAW